MARIRQTAFGALLLVIAIGGTTVLWAQGAALPASVMTASSTEVTDANTVRLLVGRSTVVDVGSAVSRVSLTSPDVADALVTSPSQLLVNGKMPGTISMFVWDRANALRRYEIIVQRDLARLSEQVRQLFPGESIDVYSNGKNIVLSGQVSNKDVIEKAVNVAAGYVDKREEVVPLLQIRDGAPSNQVLLRVRFAEVGRSAMSDMGASIFTSPNGLKDTNVLGRTSTQQYGGDSPRFDDGKLIFSDFLNLFLFDSKNGIGTVIKALQQRGQFQSLAEPNLVAESGKEASFLAGGEFPVPIATGTGSNMSISVAYKEFGIRLTFTPTVIGDRVHLKVRPEVSTLDYGNAVVLNGFRIPALSTRRTETELELQNGQTFAIAGLMDNTVSSTMQKMPGIGDIPILGLLFKSKGVQKNQTELVVMIGPEILPNNSRGVTPNLPRTPVPFMPPMEDKKSFAPAAPSFGGQSAAPAIAARPAPVQATSASSATSAAAAVSNLMPSSTPRLQGTDAPGVGASAPMAVSPNASPVSSPSAATASASTPPSPAVKPLSDKELKAAEKKRQADEEKANRTAQDQARADARKKSEEDKRLALQAEANRRAEARQQERDAKLAKEQAKRDAEAAKKAEEAAKHQSELDREYRKSLDMAAARLKAAEAAYNAELARTQQQ